MYRKNSLASVILENIGDLGYITMQVLFPHKYMYRNISRRLFGLDTYPKVTRATVYTALARLKKQGLVIRTDRRGENFSWAITEKGKQVLVEKKALTVRQEKLQPDGVTRLVIFDVPERERRKRDILRAELISCGFTQLQKSVWCGHSPLPEEFVLLISSLHLDKQVHIFDVRNKGTLEV